MRKYICLVIFILMSCLADASEYSGDYYLKTNLFLKSGVAYATNYLSADVIPIGSKVSVVELKRNLITFKYKGEVIKFKRIRKHTRLRMSAIFDRYFSRSNVLESVQYIRSSKVVKERINKCEVDVGMTKHEVLMALGYPPSHKTNIDTSDWWYYWRADGSRLMVFFVDNLVNDIFERFLSINEMNAHQRYSNMKYMLKMWEGKTKADLVLNFGPPDSVSTDGNGGEVYLYEEESKLLSINSSGTAFFSGYGNVFGNSINTFGSGNSHSNTVFNYSQSEKLLFYINADNVIYFTKFK